MSKELEKLERLTEYFETPEDEDNAKPSDVLESLESLKNIALSDLDSLPAYAIPICEKYNEKVMKDYKILHQALIKAQEQEKALKIIFEKRVDILDVEIYENYKHYCRAMENSGLRKDWWLTQEEFDLLKDFVKCVD